MSLQDLEKIRSFDDHPDFVDGYVDGRDLDTPNPNNNRSEQYKHSFWVGRAEKSGKYMPLADIIKNLERIEKLQ